MNKTLQSLSLKDKNDLFNSLEYMGGGIYRDKRVEKGKMAMTVHGNDVLELVKEIIKEFKINVP